METTMATMTSQLATEFVVPTIHLGSFKSYRLPSDRPATTGGNNNNDSHFSSNVYLHQQHGSNNVNTNNNNNIPIRSASTPYPNMQSASSHKLYMAKHQQQQQQQQQQSLGNSSSNNVSPVPIPNPNSGSNNPAAPSPPRMLPSPATQVPPVSIQPLTNPPPTPQTLGAPREVCLECMMRDEDMADVDVTSPGIWDRESDVWYHELCRREEEEERERNLHPSTSSGTSSSASCSRPRARGTKLTEANVVAWLNLNPPEPTSKQHALLAYIDAQNAILAAENKARAQALQEARQLDEKMRERESYHESCRSPYDFSEGSLKTRSPTSASPLDEAKSGIARRDTSQSSIKESMKTRKSRKPSRDSLSLVDPNKEAVHFYNLNGAGEGVVGSPRAQAAAVYGSTTSVPMTQINGSVIRNVQSMYMPNTSSNWQHQTSSPPARPASMSPDVLQGYSSQTSLTSVSPSPRKRFFGLRQWSGYFGSSNVSLAQSGSMMDMHLGLDQDKHHVHIPHVDIGSKPSSLKEGTSYMYVDGRRSLDNATETSDGPKKKRGLGKFWRMLSGGSTKSNEPVAPSHRHDLDEEPLAPPPPLSYLVNRGSMQSERSLPLARNNNRHASMPSLSLSNTSHPTTVTTPTSSKTAPARNPIMHFGSPSDQSSTLPSPTDNRPLNRDGLPDVVVAVGDDEFLDPRRKFDFNNPTRARSLSQNVISTLPAMSTFPSLTRTFSIDKNLPPLPTDEDPDTSVVPTSVSTAVPFTNSPSSSSTSPRGILSSRATLPAALQSQQAQYHQQQQQQQWPNHEEFPLPGGSRYEEPIRRQSFNGLVTRPNLPVGAGRASIPGIAQYAYDEFGNPIMSTGSRHSLAVGPMAGVQTLPNGAKRKNKLGLGSFFGKRQ